MVDQLNNSWQKYHPNFEPKKANLMQDNLLYKARSASPKSQVNKAEISAVGKSSLDQLPPAPKNLPIWTRFKEQAQKFFSSSSSLSTKMARFVQKKGVFSFKKSQKNEDLANTQKSSRASAKNLTRLESEEGLMAATQNLQGIYHANKKQEIAFEGLPSLYLPQQFGKDFPRTNSLTIGAHPFEIAKLVGQAKHSTMLKADQMLLHYLDQNETLKTNVQNLMTQSMLAGPSGYLGEGGKYIAIGSDLPQHISIQVKDNHIHISIIKGFKIHDAHDPEKLVGYRAVKREIIMPKDALKAEIPQHPAESEIKNSASLLPGGKVIDSYTQLLPLKKSQAETETIHRLYAQLGFHSLHPTQIKG